MFREYLENLPSGNTIIVSETFSGELVGTGVLMFPAKAGKTLVNLLIPGNNPAEIEKFNVLELDAIAELGNLIINAVQSSLGDMTGLGISSSVPRILHQDRPILIERELKGNNCFILCEVIFLTAGAHVEAMVCLVYNDLNLQMILDRLP
jgi:chemotaxis protein CheY-P-specific phosphatase CheC